MSKSDSCQKMVQNTIKVFARVKHPGDPSRLEKYSISEKRDHQEISLKTDASTKYGFLKNSKLKYRFNSILDINTPQNEVFENIAQPVVNSVLQGYNGTIFAYGQTGSGKTYAITGSSDYENRGIIPRSIETIFANVQKSTNVLYNVYISYLEIYNEVAYDLLNPKHRATSLEGLPRVVVLEDANGKIHLRNLTVLSVSSEREAMCLLFLGDTNRTIAETPMNLYSSRSHCIFTVHVSATMADDGRVRRSKLHLVDLAGSERLQKSSMTGNLFFDAKQINLSLHYLEQVITALSSSKKVHVPYRNSVMTTILKDSLGGNCLTVMLATLSMERQNIDETISTCKFAQRVALVSTDAIINEEKDPSVEISSLKIEIDKLKQELQVYKTESTNSPKVKTYSDLKQKDIEACKIEITNYITNSCNSFKIDENPKRVEKCFEIMKKIILQQQDEISYFTNLLDKEKRKHRQNQIATSNQSDDSVIHDNNRQLSKPSESLINNKEKRKPRQNQIATSSQSDDSVIHDNNRQLSKPSEVLINNYLSELKHMNVSLKNKYKTANVLADRIKMCKINIINIKRKLKQHNNDYPETADKVISQLQIQQDIYRESVVQLNIIKNEADHLEHGIWQSKLRLQQNRQNRKFNKPLQSSPNYYLTTDICLSNSATASNIPNDSDMYETFFNEDLELFCDIELDPALSNDHVDSRTNPRSLNDEFFNPQLPYNNESLNESLNQQIHPNYSEQQKSNSNFSSTSHYQNQIHLKQSHSAYNNKNLNSPKQKSRQSHYGLPKLQNYNQHLNSSKQNLHQHNSESGQRQQNQNYNNKTSQFQQVFEWQALANQNDERLQHNQRQNSNSSSLRRPSTSFPSSRHNGDISRRQNYTDTILQQQNFNNVCSTPSMPAFLYPNSKNYNPQRQNTISNNYSYFDTKQRNILPKEEFMLQHNHNDSDNQRSFMDLPEKLETYAFPKSSDYESMTNTPNLTEINRLCKTDQEKYNNDSCSDLVQNMSTVDVDTEEYLKTIPLTGDPEVDEEILAFYRRRQNVTLCDNN